MNYPLRLLLVIVAALSGCVQAAEGRNLSAQPARGAEQRIALVIGNAAYPGAPLLNPVNDARDMAATLRKLGFEVIEKTNATQKDMNRAIVQFGEKLRADTIALFFYAGHGMQVKGKNYLIPIDAQIASEAASRAEAVDVDTVMDQLAVSPVNIIILDACRNNPFERRFRSVGGGLAQMDAPKGSLIAYATAPGKVAADGSGRNGLYTQELLKHIQTPGLPLEAVFKRVRNGVMSASADAQTPWESSSMTGDFYFSQRPSTAEAYSPAPPPTARSVEQIEDDLWDSIKNEAKANVFEEYLKHYPNGRYLAQAQIQLAKLKPAVTRDEIGEIVDHYSKKKDDRTVIVAFHTKGDVAAAQAATVRLMRTIDPGALFNPYWIVGVPRKAINATSGCGIVVGTWYQTGFPVRREWEAIMGSMGDSVDLYSIGFSTSTPLGYEFDDLDKMKSLMQTCTGREYGKQ